MFNGAGGGRAVPHDALARAYRRAGAVRDAREADPSAAEIALLRFAGDLFAALAVELAGHTSHLRKLIDRVEQVAGIPRFALGDEVLRMPQLLELPAAVAIEVQLALLTAFADVKAISLWTLWAGGNLKHIGHAGDFTPNARNTRQLARELLSGKSSSLTRGTSVSGVVVERTPQPPAALIARGKGAAAIDCLLLLESAVPMLRATLERDELLSRGHASRQDLLGATERRLARLRFDLHDGPQQDIVMLGEDLREFRSQLETVMKADVNRNRVLGRMDDLQARLVALDGDLRRIAASVQSPFLDPESLPDSIARLADEFAARAGIEPEVTIRGAVNRLTDSQQITLLALVREALNNIREHSDAENVTVAVSAGRTGVRATITDDGCGFEPELALVRAAREGRLGLVGMHERVRLLGGQTQIDSRPGGPTVISVVLPSMAAALASKRSKS